MPPTFKTITLGIALFLSFSSLGYPQYGQLPFANQVSVVHGSPAVGYAAFDQYGQPASYDNYSYPSSAYPSSAYPSSAYPSSSYPSSSYPSSAYPSSAYPSSAYPSSADPVNELYNNNAKKPLRGLFAQGFTRTLTVLGGANFLNSIEGDGNLLGSIPGGGSLPSTTLESETGYAISFAFGRRHNHRLRSEIELALRENDSSFEFEPSAVGDILGTSLSSDDEDEIRAYSIMKNFIWGFENASRLTPYVGAGLGWSYIDLDAPSVGIDEGTGAFSYQAIGGVARSLNNAAEFIVEYRFFGTAEVDLGGIETPITYNAHNLFLGVKFEY